MKKRDQRQGEGDSEIETYRQRHTDRELARRERKVEKGGTERQRGRWRSLRQTKSCSTLFKVRDMGSKRKRQDRDTELQRYREADRYMETETETSLRIMLRTAVHTIAYTCNDTHVALASLKHIFRRSVSILLLLPWASLFAFALFILLHFSPFPPTFQPTMFSSFFSLLASLFLLLSCLFSLHFSFPPSLLSSFLFAIYSFLISSHHAFPHFVLTA